MAIDIEVEVYESYFVRCDCCNDNGGHVKKNQDAIEKVALADGWMIWEDATKEPGDPESILLILCPKCAA